MSWAFLLLLLASASGFSPRITSWRPLRRDVGVMLGISTGFGANNESELERNGVPLFGPNFGSDLRSDEKLVIAGGRKRSLISSYNNNIAENVGEEEITTYDPRMFIDSTNIESFQVIFSFDTNAPPVGIRLADDINMDIILDLDTLKLTTNKQTTQQQSSESEEMSWEMSREVESQRVEPLGGEPETSSQIVAENAMANNAAIRNTADYNNLGVLVVDVLPGSQAEAAGVKVGDMLVKTSATIGDGMWPKGNIEGVKASLQSRLAVNKQAR